MIEFPLRALIYRPPLECPLCLFMISTMDDIMNQKMLINSLYGIFDHMVNYQGMNRGSRSSNQSYYYVREPESDDTQKILANVTRKELQTILKHIPGVVLKAQFKSAWLHSDMDLNDPRNLPYIYPDYDTSRWEYDLIYNPDDHDKLITILSVWLSMENKQYNTITLDYNSRIISSNLCQEILLPTSIT